VNSYKEKYKLQQEKLTAKMKAKFEADKNAAERRKYLEERIEI